ncbi:hypothetical protein EBS67_09090, partial [bacterium]|nr:hypothetical protein [bacterium]
ILCFRQGWYRPSLANTETLKASRALIGLDFQRFLEIQLINLMKYKLGFSLSKPQPIISIEIHPPRC